MILFCITLKTNDAVFIDLLCSICWYFLAHCFIGLFLLLLLTCKSPFYILDISFLFSYRSCKYFLPVSGFLFHLCKCHFKFSKVHVSIFSFMVCAFCNLSEKTLSDPISQRLSPVFSYLIILAPTFRSVVVQDSVVQDSFPLWLLPGRVHQIFLLSFHSTICTFTSEYLIMIIYLNVHHPH